MKTKNPFLLNQYISNKYFCSRVQETERIISAVTNQRNIIVFSESGIGKTILIKHLEAELKELENYKFYYLGLKKIENLSQFISELLGAIFNKNDLKKINRYFPELGFAIKINKQTKQRQISLDKTEVNFELIFEGIKKHLTTKNKKIVFALDDIQSVLKYLSNYQIKILQNFITFSENISFILSANNLKALGVLLEEDYEKTEKIELPKIDKKKYTKFIQKRFSKENRKITKNSIEYILNWSKTNSFYTHYLCNKLYESGYKKITKKAVKEIIQNIFVEYEFVFLTYKELLSEYQWRLLKAIAKEGNVIRITSTNFINDYNLNAPSSVKTAVNALIEKGLVVRKKNSYYLINVFFEKWLSQY